MNTLPRELVARILLFARPFDWVAQWVSKDFRRTWQELVKDDNKAALEAPLSSSAPSFEAKGAALVLSPEAQEGKGNSSKGEAEGVDDQLALEETFLWKKCAFVNTPISDAFVRWCFSEYHLSPSQQDCEHPAAIERHNCGPIYIANMGKTWELERLKEVFAQCKRCGSDFFGGLLLLNAVTQDREEISLWLLRRMLPPIVESSPQPCYVAQRKFFQKKYGTELCAAAAANGNTVLLQALRKARFSWGPEVLEAARLAGHSSTEQWYLDNSDYRFSDGRGDVPIFDDLGIMIHQESAPAACEKEENASAHNRLNHRKKETTLFSPLKRLFSMTGSGDALKVKTEWEALLSMEEWNKSMHPKIRRLMCKGLPHKLRPAVWRRMLRTKEQRKRAKVPFETLRAKYLTLWKEDHLNEEQRSEWICVSRDASRVLPNVYKFRCKNEEGEVPGLLEVRDLMFTWVCDHEVSICCGRTQVMGLLLFVLDDLEDTYAAFSSIYEYLPFDSTVDIEKLRVFGLLLDNWDPELSAYLKEEQIDNRMYGYRWLALHFASFPLRIALQFWDLLVLDGPKASLMLSIAIMNTLRADLLASSFEAILAKLLQRDWLTEKIDNITSYYLKNFKKLHKRIDAIQEGDRSST